MYSDFFRANAKPKRLKEMKAMSRDPSSAAKARRAEAKESVITIKPLGASSGTSSNAGSSAAKGGGGFKKGGFKNAFGGKDEVGEGKVEGEGIIGKLEDDGGAGKGGKRIGEGEEEESEDDGLEEGERYDPRRPTGCWEGCQGRSRTVQV